MRVWAPGASAMEYVDWVTGTGTRWWAAAERVQPAADGAVSQDQLAVLLVVGAVLLTASVWLVMQLSSKLVGLFKSVVFIWICMALYNRVAEAAATSVTALRLVALVYNVTGALPWPQ